MIKPTISRRVHFFPNGTKRVGASAQHITCNDPSVPMDAGIAYVWGDRMINIGFADHNGVNHNATSVTLLQDDDATPTTGMYCRWMDYQKEQAAAAAAKKEAV